MEDQLWKLANSHFDMKAYESAAFYADKLVTISGRSDLDFVYLLASCYLQNKEYPRVTHILEKHNLLHYSIKTQVLAAQALIASKDYQTCIRILSENVQQPDKDINWQFLKHLYMGKAHEARESKQLAAEQYILALKSDPTCIEAFSSLIDKQLLTAEEETKLINELDLEKEKWLKEFYQAKLKIFSNPGLELQNLQLQSNIDVMLALANQLFSTHKVNQAFELSSKIIREDPYHLGAVPLHCGCMAALGEIGELYNLSHNLVKEYSDSPAAWYAAGVYYYAIKKYEYARKFFVKSYKIDRDYLPAWISYGHTYAAQDQSDQAMRAYRTVSRLFPGCYLANLFMGMEYLRTKNLRIALMSFELAKQVNSADPIVWNEIGVVFYKKGEYMRANEVLQEALKLCEGVITSTAETVMFNYAHTFQKLRNYQKAIELYQKCIQSNSKNASTYTALGLAYYFSNQIQEAVDCFNKALFLKSNDRFTNDLLYIALFECSEDLPMQVEPEFSPEML